MLGCIHFKPDSSSLGIESLCIPAVSFFLLNIAIVPSNNVVIK